MCINVPPPIPAMQPPNAAIACGENRSKNRSNLSGAHPAGWTETHYILQMTNGSIKSMAKPVFEASFVRAQSASWSQQNAKIMNQLLFLQEFNAITSDSFFNAESVHFTDTAKYVDPTSYADAQSRSDAKLWQDAYDKEMNGLIARKVFTVVDRPVDRNPLGTTMIFKYKIDGVKNTVTRKCRLCLRADWQKEGVDWHGRRHRRHLHKHYFMLNYSHQVYDPAERFPAELRSV